MHKLLLSCILVLFIIHGLNLSAQDSTAYFNSNELIQKAIELHDKKEYEQALAYYSMIHKSDTNYAYAASEKMLTLIALNRYEEAVKTGYEAIELKTQYLPATYDLLGTSLDYNGQTEEALTTFEKALENYPYHRQMIYNYGVTLRRAKKYKEAQEQFERALALEPFHASSHLQLAELSLLQGFRAKALIGYYSYLAISPNQIGTISNIESILNDANEEEGSISPYSSNGFEVLDAIIKAKIATQESYKPSINLNFKLTRHAEVIVKGLNRIETTDDFWGKFYLPFYQKLEEKKLLDAFLYTLVSGVNNEEIQSWIKKNNKGIQNLGTHAQETWGNYRFIQKAEIKGKIQDYEFWYYDNGKLRAVGNSDDQSNPQGPWEYYYTNGVINAEGDYDMQSTKIGTWTYYFPNGAVSSKETYDKNGNLTGDVISYHENGQVASIVPYTNGVGEGLVKRYLDCGLLEEEYTISNDLYEGSGSYYRTNGSKASDYTTTNGQLEGEYLVYHPNGKVMEALIYKEGVIHGLYKSFYPNGQLQQQGEYSNGTLDGHWLGFHPNGVKKFEVSYKEDKLSGTAKYYTDDGVMTELINYDDSGNLTGLYEAFDIDGKPFYKYEYDSGRITSFQFFNKKGEVISKGEHNLKDTTLMEGYNPAGLLNFRAYLYKGYQNGVTTFFHKNGNVKYSIQVVDNLWNGEYLEYHDNGQLKLKTTYLEGTNTGWVQQFSESGTLTSEGMSVNGNGEQVWKNYFPNGKVHEEKYLIGGELHGESTYYDYAGRIQSVDTWQLGKLIKSIEYDTLGNTKREYDIPLGVGEFKRISAQGNIVQRQTFSCGQTVGKILNYYDNGQLESESEIQLGNYSGDIKIYYPDGQLSVEGQYNAGLYDSLWVWYDAFGNKNSESFYKEGLINGNATFYHFNGSMESTCNYVLDEKHGTCEYYSPEGHLQMIKTYDRHIGAVSYQYLNEDSTLASPKSIDLKKETIVTSYFQNGKISVKQTYRNGLLDGASEYYNTQGELVQIANYKNGIEHGDQKKYFDNGKLAIETHWIDGSEEGISKYYYPNGQLMRTITYRSDQKNGWETWYKEDGTVFLKTMYRNNQIY